MARGPVNVIDADARLRVVHALCEGNAINAVVRQTGVAKTTILRLLARVGEGCARLHNRLVRGLSCALIQCDEIWSYVGKKGFRVTELDPAEWGEAYTFVALDVETRLVLAYYVGRRDRESTETFIADMRARLTVMPQISTDGFIPYEQAIGESFPGEADYGQVQKNYRGKAQRDDQVRYEPPRDPFIVRTTIYGAPDPKLISTSLVERQNRTMRMHIRRMTRLSDAFSKKLDNHRAAVALHFAFYNFVRPHETLRTAPAVRAGLVPVPLTLAQLVELALAEVPVAAPERQKLALRPGAGAARELPGGRGWLRAVPNAPVERQGNLFDWAERKPPSKPLPPPGTQLILFDDDETPGKRPH